MFKKLEEIIKKIDGNVLTIGLDENLLNKFSKNNNVNLYAISSNENNGKLFNKSKKRRTNKGKTINIKKLRKYIKKKSSKYIICNMNEMLSYYKYFIKDSIYLNNNIIYIYATEDIDKDFIISKYERYNVKTETTDYKNGYIIKVDNTLGKNNFFKDILYFMQDTFYNIAEAIGNIMVS